tara:strand:- start:14154 stop:14699 length:546 start_codon:yes stop_codon:yes gene_type:complete
MSYHETTIQVDTEVDLGFDISVADSYSGTAFDCDVDFSGTDIEITIDTSDFRDEIKEEIKETVKDELYEDIKEEIIESIAHADNPFAKLAAFVNSIDRPHKRSVDSRIDNAVIASNKTLETSWTNVCAEKDKEIEQLNKDKLELAEHIKLEKEKGEEKPALTVHLDPPQPAFPNKFNTEEK